MENNNSMVYAALKYYDQEFCVIPVDPITKKALVKWKDYQKERPTREITIQWFSVDFPNANIAVITGPVSNLVVFDFDSPAAFELCSKVLMTRITKTGRGFHASYRYTNSCPSQKIRNPDIDLKANGGYVIMPPSKHENGTVYEFLNESEPIAELLDINPILTQLETCLNIAIHGITEFTNTDTESQDTDTIEFYESQPIELGRTPSPCIQEILAKGCGEGERDDRCFDIVRYLFAKGKEKTYILKKLISWNQKNRPPLDDTTLQGRIDSVFEKGYAFGCGRLLDSHWCQPNCIYRPTTATPPEDKPVVLQAIDPDIEQAANELLADPNMFDTIKVALDVDIIGEDENKQLLFILLLSSKLVTKTIIQVKGDSSSGKTHLASKVAQYFNTKVYARISDRFAGYLADDLADYDLLYLQEADLSSTSELRFFGGDDGPLTIGVVDMQKRKKKPLEITTPAISVLTTTTKIFTDEQLDNRSFIISPDQSDDQTKEIVDYAVHTRELQTINPIIDNTHNLLTKEVIKTAISLLEKNIRVIVSFGTALVDANLFDTTQLRARRDCTKLMQVIRYCTVLYQRQRPFIENNDTKYYFSTIDDLRMALKLCAPILRAFTGLEQRLIGAIISLQEYFKIPTSAVESLLDDNAQYPDAINVKEAQQLFGVGERQSRHYLNKLTDTTYLVKDLDPRDKRKKMYFKTEKLGNAAFDIVPEISNAQVRTAISSFFENYYDTDDRLRGVCVKLLEGL